MEGMRGCLIKFCVSGLIFPVLRGICASFPEPETTAELSERLITNSICVLILQRNLKVASWYHSCSFIPSAMSSKQFFTLIEFRETIENNPYFLEQWFPTGAVPSTDGR
uniref:Uncharacterized protein n=1 Tax=Rhodnius prolixus TaxID=13249 RepID=T1HE97_RHOPR